ncbi:MAG: hypothetical protein MUO88_05555 [Desulfobacterales bacterium]|nr:hypothetical protein [Desulfobacterales bacterium]
MVDRRITRRVVRRPTPATLPGVAGLPTLASASLTTIPLWNPPSTKRQAASKLNPITIVRTFDLIFITAPPLS